MKSSDFTEEQASSQTEVQIQGYLSESPIPRTESPMEYWRSNKSRFPTLAQLARKYLSAPCTSVDSERLFSAAAHVVDEKTESDARRQRCFFLSRKISP
ncbi:hypothetical protein SKAU_G00157740 [Synaphobranchus kaupii]|uniref:HAT C-terminal dimerisation domain-containing protein n=1 Tax=Synaphobranchus kaupii TaxID=118154 RepID=A0A9Q1IXB3_SYNKA|nr:hypothetical protein SKAU_G00157740 [Synaphobranchus kaupii]